MNAHPDLDREHILGVSQSAATSPTTLRASSTEVTLLFATERQRERADRALSRCGYATETGALDGVHPYGVRVTGWSTDGLERRGAALRSATTRFGTDEQLQDTVTRAVEAAADYPADADPRTVSYDVATEVTNQVINGIIDDAGPIIPLTRFPADPQLGELVRDVHGLADRLTSTIGDHFNVACIAAGTYVHACHDQPDDAARAEAWSEANAFIAAPVDPDAFIEAAEWAHLRHPEEAGAFALDYARTYRGTDRDRRPPPEEAYPGWRDAASSAPQVAAADFPHPPDTAPADEPGPAHNTTGPHRAHAPRGPR